MTPENPAGALRRLVGTVEAAFDEACEALRAAETVCNSLVAHNRKLADALAASVGDENGECVACGGSAVGDAEEHFDGCWVGELIGADPGRRR